MSLDAPKSDAELLAIYQRQQVRPPVPITRNGVALGPDSPLRVTTRQSSAAAYARRKTEQYEHEEQVKVFEWAEKHAARCPHLAKLFAVPNGGFRSPRTAGRLKAEGVKPGIPDVFLLVPRDVYHGLLIEMKRPGGVLSPSQADWHCAFAKDGFRVVLATTFEQVRDHVVTYLGLNPAGFP